MRAMEVLSRTYQIIPVTSLTQKYFFKQNQDKVCDLSVKHDKQIILMDSSQRKDPSLLTLKQTFFSFNVA